MLQFIIVAAAAATTTAAAATTTTTATNGMAIFCGEATIFLDFLTCYLLLGSCSTILTLLTAINVIISSVKLFAIHTFQFIDQTLAGSLT